MINPREHGLADIPADFMPELRTAIDPVVESEIRFAAHVFGDMEVLLTTVSRTREMIEGRIEPARALIDAGLRDAVWYIGQALAVKEPSAELRAFIASAEVHRIGSVYSAKWCGECPVDVDSIRTIDALVKWAALPSGEMALEQGTPRPDATMAFGRELVVCGNGDESEAVARLCGECAFMVAGFRIAHHGSYWRISPELDVRTDMYGRKCVSLYARVAAYADKGDGA